MPPWPEWQVEYIGTRFLGKLLGLWSVFWISILRKLFHGFGENGRNPAGFSTRNSIGTIQGKSDRPWTFASVKIRQVLLLTIVMLSLWRLATLRPIWSAADEQGHRVIVAFLFLVTACWLISAVWIFLKKRPGRGGNPVTHISSNRERAR